MTAVDPALRTTLHFAFSRRLYGITVAEMPHARSVLAGVFTDLLTVDATPDELVAYRLQDEALRDLAAIMGARGYLRDGPYAAFGETLRQSLATATSYESTRDYEHGLFLTAHACTERWRDARRQPGTPGFLADSTWLRAVLHRVAGRRAGRLRPLPDKLTDAIMTELTTRLADHAAFGLER